MGEVGGMYKAWPGGQRAGFWPWLCHSVLDACHFIAAWFLHLQSGEFNVKNIHTLQRNCGCCSVWPGFCFKSPSTLLRALLASITLTAVLFGEHNGSHLGPLYYVFVLSQCYFHRLFPVFLLWRSLYLCVSFGLHPFPECK